MTAAHQRVPSTDKRRADTGGQHAPPAPDTAVFPAPGSSEEKRKKSGFLGSLIKRKTGVPLGKSSKEDSQSTASPPLESALRRMSRSLTRSSQRRFWLGPPSQGHDKVSISLPLEDTAGSFILASSLTHRLLEP